jgi:hypothetical protein
VQQRLSRSVSEAIMDEINLALGSIAALILTP